MRILLIPFLCVFLASSASGQTPIDVYIFAGQSNMVGFLGQGLVPPGVQNPNPNIPYSYKITGAGTTIFQSPSLVSFGTVAGSGGSEMTFAQEVFERTDRRIAIVKVAANGTSLHYDWNINTAGVWYDALVAQVTTARSQLVDAGYTPNMSGFFWTQGEGDSNAPWQSDQYQQNLTNMLQSFRADISSEVPVYLNHLHINADRAAAVGLRTAQDNVAATVPNVKILSIDDLALGADKLHFTTETHLELGRRWADFIYPSGDFNYDNAVDDLDLAIWKSTVGGADMRGDGNSDNVVDGSDFLLWQRQRAMPPAPPVASVPEPSSSLLALASVAFLGFLKRRSHARKWTAA